MENNIIEDFIASYKNQGEKERYLEAKKPALGWLPSLFVGVVLAGLKTAAENIKDESGRAVALFALDLAGAIGQMLTDADKENAAQIANFFKDNWQNISREAAKVVRGIVESKAKDGVAKSLVLQGLDLVLVNL